MKVFQPGKTTDGRTCYQDLKQIQLHTATENLRCGARADAKFSFVEEILISYKAIK